MMNLDQKEVVKTVTGIVATHEREEELDQMLSSFRSSYPGLKFVIADNSFNPYPRSDVTYLQLDPEAGISKSRNRALEEVHTSYTLLLDDDLLRIDDTKLESLMRHLKDNHFDIVAGDQREVTDDFEFQGRYELVDGILFHYVGIDSGLHEGASKFDVTPNFFIGKTEVIKDLGGWDENLRFAKEHDDFFLKAKEADYSVGYLRDVAALNNSISKHHGGNRAEACTEHFLKKWGVTDKIEVRWLQSPFSKLDFYSAVTREDFQPSKEQFLLAMQKFKSQFTDFEVINPFE